MGDGHEWDACNQEEAWGFAGRPGLPHCRGKFLRPLGRSDCTGRNHSGSQSPLCTRDSRAGRVSGPFVQPAACGAELASTQQVRGRQSEPRLSLVVVLILSPPHHHPGRQLLSSLFRCDLGKGLHRISAGPPRPAGALGGLCGGSVESSKPFSNRGGLVCKILRRRRKRFGSSPRAGSLGLVVVKGQRYHGPLRQNKLAPVSSGPIILICPSCRISCVFCFIRHSIRAHSSAQDSAGLRIGARALCSWGSSLLPSRPLFSD